MELEKYYPFKLNENQKEVVESLLDFLDSEDKVFLLKGYAGTGKTSLVKGLIDYLKDIKKPFLVAAPTGRAAKILRKKTGVGVTIHKMIYNFQILETIRADEEKDYTNPQDREDKFAKQSFKYRFPVIKLEEAHIIIVDEASMVTSKLAKQELFEFGSDILLKDLLEFAAIFNEKSIHKIIFIGDPAQLPPIGDKYPWALMSEFWERKNIPFREVFLSQIMRQENGSILTNAMRIRDCIEAPSIRELQFDFDEHTINANELNITATYCDNFPLPTLENGVIITFSNAQALHYNNEIRKTYFPNNEHICAGDIIQILNNNYYTYGIEIYNGDFAQIISVEGTETLTAPVFVDGNRKKNITIVYRKVTLRLSDYDTDIVAYINETTLKSDRRDITSDEMKSAYINAVMRFKDKHPNERTNSEMFRDFLRADLFFNAIRCKYGYAITGHKSQGGEWETIIVDYSQKVSLAKDNLRWCYTTTTRASKKLYALHSPYFGNFQKLKFSAITSIGKIPEGVLNFEQVPLSPYHNDTLPKCTSWMYWNIVEKCENTPISIANVQSFQYQERYFFNIEEREVKAEVYYNNSGIFKDFKLTGDPEDIALVKSILAKPDKNDFAVDYTASLPFLEGLYQIVSASCNDLEIPIINIIEQKDKYYVNYYLKTDNSISHLQFYFNKLGKFSTTMVQTLGNENDQKLKQLIDKIERCATNQ